MYQKPPLILSLVVYNTTAMTLTQHRRPLPRLPLDLVLYSQLVEYFRQKVVRLLMNYRTQIKEERACKLARKAAMFVLNHSRPRPSPYASDSWPSCAEELSGNKENQCTCSLKDICPRSYSWDSQDNNSREKYISEIYAFSSTQHKGWFSLATESESES